MKLIKQASGKTTIKMSRSEWESYGRKAGWMKEAQPAGGDLGIGHGLNEIAKATKGMGNRKVKELVDRILAGEPKEKVLQDYPQGFISAVEQMLQQSQGGQQGSSGAANLAQAKATIQKNHGILQHALQSQNMQRAEQAKANLRQYRQYLEQNGVNWKSDPELLDWLSVD